ncbi:hypothetical protein MNV49_005489 [Pseudohyphozyma bogoriensis]|nr:hypothetical protein MNV49_005489 [Pseudohyphozyma bogoriensis]
MTTHEANISVQDGKVVEKHDGKTISTKDLQHVLAGYRATLSNATTSDEAKDHARERIAFLEAASHDAHDKDPSHVIGGLKAALNNENVHEDTKKEIRNRLHEMGVELDA